MHRWAAAAALVLLLGGACSSNTHVLRTTKGKATTTSSPPTTMTASTALAASTTSPPTTHLGPPQTSRATVPAASLPATTPSGPPPAASTGRGAIVGHVYAGCANGQPSGCRSQGGVGGETLQVKQGSAVVASAVTAADGTYRVEVPAGTYDVELAGTGQSRRVVVNAGQTVVVNFTSA